MKNCSRFLEQLALMEISTSQDVGRSGLGHIAIRTKRINFKSHHISLSPSMSTAKPSKVVSSSMLLVPSKSASGRYPSYTHVQGRYKLIEAAYLGACPEFLFATALGSKIIVDEVTGSSFLASLAMESAIPFPSISTGAGIHWRAHDLPKAPRLRIKEIPDAQRPVQDEEPSEATLRTEKRKYCS
ncbi:hypothetical protein TNCV_116951 [Trichonephila clavipes]|nr:hypothetical protein TNCV_116951 [Trichonephila clavipes]